MSTLLTRRTVILAKTGADVVPAAEDGILCDMAPEISPEGERIERDPVRDTYSPLGHVIGSKQNPLQMAVECKGGGTDTGILAPEYEPLLLACGMQKVTPTRLALDAGDDASMFRHGESVSNGSGVSGMVVQIFSGSLVVANVTGGSFADLDSLTGETSGASATVTGTPETVIAYRPVTDPASIQPCTIYYHRDGILHKAPNCLGNVSLDWSVDAIGKFTFNMSGLYSDPVTQSMPTPVITDLIPPVVQNIGLRLGGYTPVINSVSANLNNTVTPRKDLNAEEGIIGFRITGRRPTGSIDPEADTLDNFNPWADWQNGATAALGGSVGQTAGNRVGLFAPSIQHESVSYSDRDGIVTYSLPFVCTGDTDNEIWLIFS